MCGRFTLTSTPEALAERFGIAPPESLAPRYNIAPGQMLWTLRGDPEASVRVWAPARWGLVPSWAKYSSVGSRMINARSETAAEKPAFRRALRARRCLIPADGFYEWAERDGRKQAFYIGLRGRGVFGFAGLWERWRDSSGAALESCTILTGAANETLQEIHPRMPVMLAPEHYAAWLDPELHDPTALQPLYARWRDAAFAFHPVSSRVNDARVDDAACIAPTTQGAPQQALF
jgi:putative SOS response-associated peptidase YedK